MENTEVTSLVDNIVFCLRKDLINAVEHNVVEEDGSIGKFDSPYGIIIKQKLVELFKDQGYGE